VGGKETLFRENTARDGAWPEGDHVNAPPTAAICGQNSLFPPERMGCGEPIATCAEVYRCTECSVPFHKKCAEKHFGKSAVDRQAIINDVFGVLAKIQAALVHDDAWEERGRRALALVTERLTRPAT
jgi:hypothetical protein